MYHGKCGSNIYVDVSQVYQILAEIGMLPRESHLQTTRIHLFQKENKLRVNGYFCQSCNREIELDEIMFRCRSCGISLPIKDAFVPRDSNGSFCKKCIAEMFPEEDILDMTELLSSNILHII